MKLEVAHEQYPIVVKSDTNFNKKFLNMDNSYPETQIARIYGRIHL